MSRTRRQGSDSPPDPEYERALDRGIEALRRGDVTSAVHKLQGAVALRETTTALLHLTEALHAAGRRAAARECAHRAAELAAPTDVDVLLRAAARLCDVGEYEAAMPLAHAASARRRDARAARVAGRCASGYAASLERADGEWADALAEIRRAADDLGPDDSAPGQGPSSAPPRPLSRLPSGSLRFRAGGCWVGVRQVMSRVWARIRVW